MLWLSSKAGNEFITTSTDGTVKWWDYRNINEVVDQLVVRETQAESNGLIIGSNCFEYVADYGPKYLIGTEMGSIMLATKKPKKSVEINYNNSYGLEKAGRHLGPVTSIKRNPLFP